MKFILLFITLIYTTTVQSEIVPLSQVGDISTEALKDLLAKHPETFLIDVRTQYEVNRMGGTIKARNNLVIPRGWLELRIADAIPDKNATIVTYCGTNKRSPLAAETLSKMGYLHVKNYVDGFTDWKQSGLAINSPDLAPNSMLYRKPQKVIDGVWSAIGATTAPSYENSGHNNNLSFIITSQGVVVINAGDNYLVANALHQEIKKITSQPVKYVVLENGLGASMLGSNYWQQQGIPIIAHANAATEIKTQGAKRLQTMQNGRKDKAQNTKIVLPNKTFKDKLAIELGGERIELIHLGPAHGSGDIIVWLPNKKLVIAGSVAVHQRLLSILEDTDTAAWIKTWDKLAKLQPKYVIPGHGEPTNLKEVTKYTRDYLVFIRNKIAALLESGGDLQEAYNIDQSPYADLDLFKTLSKLNADRVFRAMEFE